MNKLKMTKDEIRKLMFIKESNWQNELETNGYAFALGLDVAEDDIVKNAYNPGVIGAHAKGVELKELEGMSIEDRMFLDLSFLGVSWCLTDTDDVSRVRIEGNGSKIDNLNISWIVSLYKHRGCDLYHMTRKSCDGVWWHKFGWYSPPSEVRYRKNDNPSSDLGDYQYIKTFRLSYNQKITLE